MSRTFYGEAAHSKSQKASPSAGDADAADSREAKRARLSSQPSLERMEAPIFREPRNLTLIHFDAHPDLSVPAAMPADVCHDPEALYNKITISDWILPLVYQGYLERIVWIKPSYFRGSPFPLPDGEYTWTIGKHKATGHLAIHSPHVYHWFDDDESYPHNMLPTQFAMLDELEESSRRHVAVWMISMPGTRHGNEAWKIAMSKLPGFCRRPGRDLGGVEHSGASPNIWLDIDLDGFGAHNPFYEVLRTMIPNDRDTRRQVHHAISCLYTRTYFQICGRMLASKGVQSDDLDDSHVMWLCKKHQQFCTEFCTALDILSSSTRLSRDDRLQLFEKRLIHFYCPPHFTPKLAVSLQHRRSSLTSATSPPLVQQSPKPENVAVHSSSKELMPAPPSRNPVSSSAASSSVALPSSSVTKSGISDPGSVSAANSASSGAARPLVSQSSTPRIELESDLDTRLAQLRTAWKVLVEASSMYPALLYPSSSTAAAEVPQPQPSNVHRPVRRFVHDYGLMCELPHYDTAPPHRVEMLHLLRDCWMAIGAHPQLATLARSVDDGFTPSEWAPSVEKDLCSALQECFGPIRVVEAASVR